MTYKTTTISARIPNEHLKRLQEFATSRNLPLGTLVRVLLREILQNRIQIRLP
jgi:hypothetical protein